MPKALNEKSIRITAKPPKKVGIMPSYSDGEKQSKVTKPKSLTPKGASSKKK
jgi:hypothetical protein